MVYAVLPDVLSSPKRTKDNSRLYALANASCWGQVRFDGKYSSGTGISGKSEPGSLMNLGRGGK